MTVTLVLGGQRSGKSAYAEDLLAAVSPKTYVATASARDGEMQQRISDHRLRRGADWVTVEAPLDIVAHLGAGPVLVDCLTLWLANIMEAEQSLETETDKLVSALEALKGPASAPVVLVSGEVGLGVIPENALARRYADALGLLNQRVAAAADKAVLVAAGLPMILKDESNA